jgi:hypothetical protein
MRLLSGVLTLLVSVSGGLFAQEHWEVGGAAGYGIFRNVNVTGPTMSGTTGFDNGVAASAVLGQDLYRFIGGEIRYTYQRNELKVSSGGTTATMSGDSHALHYDVLFHAASREAVVRPYLAAGAGVRYFRGTGAEHAYQPLMNLVALTSVNQAEPLLSAGGGVKIALEHNALLRLDFRDYATPFPSSLLATLPGVRAGGWVHDFVVLVGLSKTF